MNSCCQAPQESQTGKFFSRWSKKYAKKVRRGKLEKVQRLLLEGVRAAGTVRTDVLDVGCGAGALHLTLLTEGARSAVGVDMSQEMLNHARSIAENRGVSDRTTYLLGDVVALGETVPLSDVTVMDKVVCCYENLPALIHTAAIRTRRVLALSHPCDNWPMQLVFRTQIFFAKVFRADFRPWWHDWQAMERMIEQEGLTLFKRDTTPMWSILIYARNA